MTSLSTLPASTVRLISSGQVVSQGALSVVKELVENAFDANATNVMVRVQRCGLDFVEVRDNGAGILDFDLPKTVRPFTTSKLADWSDLGHLESFGFRGEALHAICSLADVEIASKPRNEQTLGFKYAFDREANVTARNVVQINPGTTVTVSNLYSNLPVRRRLLEKQASKKDEQRKLERLCTSYALAKTKARISLQCDSKVVFMKKSSADRNQGLRDIFGFRIADGLALLTYECQDFSFELYVPQKIEGNFGGSYNKELFRSNSDRCFLIVNSRPIENKPMSKIIRSNINSHFDVTSYPMWVAYLSCPSDTLDVNMDPSKTSVLFRNQKSIEEALSNTLAEYYRVKRGNRSSTPDVAEAIASESSFTVGEQGDFSKISNTSNSNIRIDSVNSIASEKPDEAVVLNRPDPGNLRTAAKNYLMVSPGSSTSDVNMNVSNVANAEHPLMESNNESAGRLSRSSSLMFVEEANLSALPKSPSYVNNSMINQTNHGIDRSASSISLLSNSSSSVLTKQGCEKATSSTGQLMTRQSSIPRPPLGEVFAKPSGRNTSFSALDMEPNFPRSSSNSSLPKPLSKPLSKSTLRRTNSSLSSSSSSWSLNTSRRRRRSSEKLDEEEGARRKQLRIDAVIRQMEARDREEYGTSTCDSPQIRQDIEESEERHHRITNPSLERQPSVQEEYDDYEDLNNTRVDEEQPSRVSEMRRTRKQVEVSFDASLLFAKSQNKIDDKDNRFRLIGQLPQTGHWIVVFDVQKSRIKHPLQTLDHCTAKEEILFKKLMNGFQLPSLKKRSKMQVEASLLDGKVDLRDERISKNGFDLQYEDNADNEKGVKLVIEAVPALLDADVDAKDELRRLLSLLHSDPKSSVASTRSAAARHFLRSEAERMTRSGRVRVTKEEAENLVANFIDDDDSRRKVFIPIKPKQSY